MGEETYYTVLNVAEAASPSEIKASYRDLIKQVHPDTIANLAPYLRRIAEDKAKEITEAYSVLSSTTKRREYDRQLAEYRRQTTSHAPPPRPTTPPAQQTSSQTSSAPYCNWCGGPLYGGGFCPKCNKFTAPAGAPHKPTTARSIGYKFGQNWAILLRWSHEHPIFAVVIPLIFCWLIATLLSSNDTSPRAPIQPTQATIGKDIAPATGADTAASKTPAPAKPAASLSGAYVGTIHNQTANLSSSFVVILHQTKAGVLEGCTDIKPPLYGSGALHGSVQGTHLSFIASYITYQGDASKNEIAGSYGLSQEGKDQVGDFHLVKQKGAQASYECANGVATEVATATSPSTASQQFSDVPRGSKLQPPNAKPHLPIRAVVTGDYRYSTLYKRCAFLPSDNYGRCGFGSETVAELKKGDRVTVLSPLTRAENGQDIYKVRTEQGWVGWIGAQGLTLEPQ